MNLKNKINKQNRNRFIDTENILMVARWEGVGRTVKKVKGLRHMIGGYRTVMGK